MNLLTNEYLDKAISTTIGRFFFDQSVSDKLRADDFTKDTLTERCEIASKKINCLKIINVHFDGKDICITTSRPGLLVGKKCEQLEKLTAYLRKEFQFETIKIIEDRIICCMYDFHYVLSGFEDGY